MTRTVHLRILVEKHEAKAIKAAASKAHLSVSTWGRSLMLGQTKKPSALELAGSGGMK